MCLTIGNAMGDQRLPQDWAWAPQWTGITLMVTNREVQGSAETSHCCLS